MGNIRDALKSIILAVVAVAAISAFLSWQYDRMEKSQEGKTSLEDLVEQSSAQKSLDKFMTARVNNDEDQATLFLTERAMAQKNAGDFNLIGNFKDYAILTGKKLPIFDDEEKYQFAVKISGRSGMDEIIETIILVKILENYYVDSINIAG